MSRQMIVLTDGYSTVRQAKTAVSIIRYRPKEVVAVLDRQTTAKTAQELFNVGGTIPVIGSVEEAPKANSLLVGVAPAGGRLPKQWRPILLNAIQRKLNIYSGLHDFLNEDLEFARAAGDSGSQLIDVRANDEHDVAKRQGIRLGCLRIHTIGDNCSCGKMVTSIELTQSLKQAKVDAKFVATGQTGILIEGDGCPIDCVVADFVAGAAEQLVLANQHHDVIVVEGQGSLFHPRYSGVTLGLMHGLMPDGLILCHELGSTTYTGMNLPLPQIAKVREFSEAAANIMHPCRVIGVSVNSSSATDAEWCSERSRLEQQLRLPVCDTLRDGPFVLTRAILELKQQLGK